jgi:hypothetical protein
MLFFLKKCLSLQLMNFLHLWLAYIEFSMASFPFDVCVCVCVLISGSHECYSYTLPLNCTLNCSYFQFFWLSSPWAQAMTQCYHFFVKAVVIEMCLKNKARKSWVQTPVPPSPTKRKKSLKGVYTVTPWSCAAWSCADSCNALKAPFPCPEANNLAQS